MRFIFSFLSIAYVTGIFILAPSPMVQKVSAFNPYSLLHIPLYGILTGLLIFSFIPIKKQHKNLITLKHIKSTSDPNVPNHPNEPTSIHQHISASTHQRFIIAGIMTLMVAIADEIYQSTIPTRDASIFDVLFDFIGISLASLFISGWYRRLGRTHKP